MKEIIIGKSVGDIEFGKTEEELADMLKAYEKKPIDEFGQVFYKSKFLELMFKGAPRRLVQIDILEDDTEHKFLGKIGINSTMAELEEVAGSYFNDNDIFELKKYPGIAFVLGDRDDWPDDYWDEKGAPIVEIHVFLPNKN